MLKCVFITKILGKDLMHSFKAKILGYILRIKFKIKFVDNFKVKI
jgi:hypothetical protein